MARPRIGSAAGIWRPLSERSDSAELSWTVWVRLGQGRGRCWRVRGAVRAGVLEVAAMYWEMPTPLAIRFRRESTSSPMVETRLTRSVVRLPWAHGVCKTHRPRHGPTTRGFERPDGSLRGTSPSPATWLALVVAEVPPLRVQASRREGRQKRRRACRSMLSMVALREIRPRRPTQAARWTCSSARRLATSMRGSSA